ncbi:hypothetical protein D3C87_1684090 [compost metagenome]
MQPAAEPTHEFAGVRAEIAAAAKDDADGADASCRKAECAGVRPVAQFGCGFQHAFARRLLDFRIAAECAADRGLRQPQPACELLEIHFFFPLTGRS